MADEHIYPSSQPVPPRTPAAGEARDQISPTPVDGTAPAARPPLTVKSVLKRLWGSSSEPGQRQSDGTREIVETVVFVVVLVLMLKSFAAEAFVIPTGSMAVTLLGYQKDVTCPQCGEDYYINCSQEGDPPSGQPTPVTGGICQNCQDVVEDFGTEKPPLDPSCRSGDRVLVFKGIYDGVLASNRDLPREGLCVLAVLVSGVIGAVAAGFLFTRVLKRPDGSPPSGLVVFSGKLGGAVILALVVGILAFSSGPAWAMAGPERLDVVVFKYPEGPQKNYTPMNYIKRLIGLPGETIAIHAGKIYALEPGQGPQYDEGPDVPKVDLWKKKYMHENDARAFDLFQKGKFKIVRKPPAKILAMHRLVYDYDHPAKDLTGPDYQRWVGVENAGDWTADGEHGFKHDNDKGTSTAWLRYRNLVPFYRDRTGKPVPALITDFMSYNTWHGASWYIPGSSGSREDYLRHVEMNQNWVSDLILECEVTVEAPAGDFILELSKGEHRYQARWNLGTGECTLWRLTGTGENGQKEKEEQLAAQPTALKGKGTYEVRFANVDDRLTVWVGHSLPFGDGVEHTPDGTPPPVLLPTTNDLHKPASIGAAGNAGVRVQKIKLWRDTYYTISPGSPDLRHVLLKENEPNPSGLVLKANDPDLHCPQRKNYNPLRQADWVVDWTDTKLWTRCELPVKTLYVQPGHYLCMGDNSPESSDSRQWGTVPERLMLGRALLVYYPFNRAGRIR